MKRFNEVSTLRLSAGLALLLFSTGAPMSGLSTIPAAQADTQAGQLGSQPIGGQVNESADKASTGIEVRVTGDSATAATAARKHAAPMKQLRFEDTTDKQADQANQANKANKSAKKKDKKQCDSNDNSKNDDSCYVPEKRTSSASGFWWFWIGRHFGARQPYRSSYFINHGGKYNESKMSSKEKIAQYRKGFTSEHPNESPSKAAKSSHNTRSGKSHSNAGHGEGHGGIGGHGEGHGHGG